MSAFDSIYMTFPNIQSAQAMAKSLLSERLIGCANLFPGVESWYRWEGQIQCDPEIVLIAKAPQRNRDAILNWVKGHHPYQVPCVLFRAISHGSSDYLEWLRSETLPQGPG